MDIVKPWYLSRTIWASVVAVTASVAGLFDVSFAEADAELLADAIVRTVAALAGLIAIFGRLAASTRIG